VFESKNCFEGYVYCLRKCRLDFDDGGDTEMGKPSSIYHRIAADVRMFVVYMMILSQPLDFRDMTVGLTMADTFD